ncbi:MAG: TatD family hydrolase, partial [Acidobacteriota bacterium]
LAAPGCDGDRELVGARARAAGVEAISAVGETLEDARKNLDLAAQYPGLVHPCGGLHPERIDPKQAVTVEGLIRDERHRFIAIGEVGLDHWKVQEEKEREVQREIFARFLDLSVELDLPLNVHSRAAGQATIELLLEGGAKRVQLHAFDGRAAKALPAVEAGYFFSVPPSVVRSTQKQKLVRRLPLGCLLVETDSPVLGPTREERNEPANVKVSLDAICALKDLSPEEVQEAMEDNTRRLYGNRMTARKP